MKKILLLVCGVFLIISGGSCKPANVSTPSPSETADISSIWLTTWLTQPACKPPCWQNITPAVTTKDEAVSILEKMTGTTVTYNYKNGVGWEFGSTKNDGGWLGAQDGIVDFVVLDLVQSKLTLETLVASYGYPSHIEPYDCQQGDSLGMCLTMLIYPDLGMLVDTDLKDLGNHRVEVQPETEIWRITLIQPGLENYKKIPDFQDYGILMEWKGYGSYP
jgi:hypothetical protein